ncbi:uncharacterized protein RCC_11430 [Ramularia collo-cygni]|uniref:DUF7371 domain-containing protein n=1 Tax=Ramularia collo-cygni TaxID=112498 RepID=A0A2D3V8D3_9PEZI|nr:uncharacterized protein RCC_11430 [Ramularia collo-cygni]CZT25761.1 uncharacterized protein RCC_11430 [Ramularia collo-cygni]
MDFDDLPTFHSDRAGKRNDRRQSNGTFNNGSDITRQPPLSLRPYHHLTFSNGFVYAPVPVAPFTPISQPNVAAFLADGTSMRTGGRPDGTGEISDGPTPDDVSAFWFDAFGGFLGCDNAGPDDCTMEVTGLHWDPIANDEAPAFTQKYSLPPCPAYRNCALTLITFPSTARRLSGLEVRAVRNGEPRRFFMDDMHMAWSNKTCDAGLLRQQAQ